MMRVFRLAAAVRNLQRFISALRVLITFQSAQLKAADHPASLCLILYYLQLLLCYFSLLPSLGALVFIKLIFGRVVQSECIFHVFGFGWCATTFREGGFDLLMLLNVVASIPQGGFSIISRASVGIINIYMIVTKQNTTSGTQNHRSRFHAFYQLNEMKAVRVKRFSISLFYLYVTVFQ